MWKYLYTINDNVMGEYSAPFLANNDRHARSIFDHAVAEAEKAGYKSEFDLYRIGQFNMSTGEIKAVEHYKVKEIEPNPEKDMFEEE